MRLTIRSPSWLAPAVFSLCCVALAIFGATVLRDAMTVPADWIVVQGRVVAYDERTSTDGTMYAPIVEYLDAGRAAHRVTAAFSSNYPPAAGSSIEVAYDPASPAHARVTGGLPGFLWLAVTVFGAGLALMLGIASYDSWRRPGVESLAGIVTTDARTARLRFSRSPAYALFQLVGSWFGALMFLGFAAFLVTSGFPLALFSPIAGLFGAVLLLGGIAAARRGRDLVLIEVGPDGVWLPGLGERRWDEFSDIRVEAHVADGRDDEGPPAGTTIDRHLGFVPRNPALAARRDITDRLATGLVAGLGRVSRGPRRRDAIDHAPFGVRELDLRRDAFERLIAAVEAYHPVGALFEEPGAALPSWAPTARREVGDADEEWRSTEMRIEGGGAVATVANLLLVSLPARFGRRLWFAQLGFVCGLVLAVAVRLPGGPSGSPIPTLVLTVMLVVFGWPIVSAVRRARPGDAVSPIMAMVVIGALLGAMVSTVVVSGTGGRDAGSPSSGPETTAAPT